MKLVIDRIQLTLDGLPAAQAELVAARLQAALAVAWTPASPGPAGEPPQPELSTDLTGDALVRAIANRLIALAGLSAARLPELQPWP